MIMYMYIENEKKMAYGQVICWFHMRNRLKRNRFTDEIRKKINRLGCYSRTLTRQRRMSWSLNEKINIEQIIETNFAEHLITSSRTRSSLLHRLCNTNGSGGDVHVNRSTSLKITLTPPVPDGSTSPFQ